MAKSRITGVQATTAPTLEGQRVSLNFNKRSLFGIPGTTFELFKARPSNVIPKGLTQAQLQLIQDGIRTGELVLSAEPIVEPPKVEAALAPYIATLTLPSVNETAVYNMLNGMMFTADRDPKLGYYTRRDVLMKLRHMETEGRNRGFVLDLIDKAIEQLPGPSYPKDEVVTAKAGASEDSAPAVAVTPSKADIESI